MDNRTIEITNAITELTSLDLNTILIPEDRSWKTWFKHRAASFAALIGSIGIIPLNTFKAIVQLMTGQPFEALKTFFLGIGSGISFSLLSLLALLAPGLTQKLMGKMLVPAWYYFPKNPKYTLNKKPNNLINYELKTTQFFIQTDKGNVDAIKITVRPEDAEEKKAEDYSKYTIHFLGNGGSFQNAEFTIDCFYESLRTRRHVIICNHPGANPHETSYTPLSRRDLANVGIAAVTQLAKQHHWSNADIAKNIQLSGMSLGGAVALQIALHFKKKFNILIPIHVDRSFGKLSHVIAAHLADIVQVPMVYAEKLAAIMFYSTEWELDSAEAYKQLTDPGLKLHCMNIADHLPPPDKSFIERMRDKSGLNRLRDFIFGEKPAQHSDPIILDGTTLSNALSTTPSSHTTIITKLDFVTANLKYADGKPFSQNDIMYSHSDRHSIGLVSFYQSGQDAFSIHCETVNKFNESVSSPVPKLSG